MTNPARPAGPSPLEQRLDSRPGPEYDRGPMHPPTRLRLPDYFVIEGLNAFACTIFGSCLYFWTRARYGYSDADNLWLGSLQGLAYVLVPPLGGRLGDRWGHDHLVRAGTLGMLAATLLTWLIHLPWLPFLTLPLFIAAMSLTWPSLEAAVVLHPGRLSTPDRLGIYNLVWSALGSISFFSAGALFQFTPDAMLLAVLVFHALQLAWLFRPHHPDTQSEVERAPHRGDNIPQATKRTFKRLGWLGNGVSYLMLGGLMTLAPTLGDRLALPPSSAIWMIGALFVARAATFALLWRWPGWHYRLPWMLSALAAGPLALAVIFFAGHLLWLVPALLLLGICVGLSYYSSIYYSLDYGDEKGEHGGWHESIIGLGGLLGPLAGVGGLTLTGHVHGATTGVLLVTALITATGSALILRRRD
jgi:MFS family permease